MYKVLFEGEHHVQSMDGNIVVDPCFSACIFIETGGKKIIIDPSNRGMAQRVIDELAMLSVVPEEIDYVLNTHFHYDHSFNNYLFPNAQIFTIASNWLSKRVEAADKLEEVLQLDAIRIIGTPGHVADHMSVLLQENGEHIVFAGDAVDEKMLRSGHFSDFVYHKELYIESALTVLSLADILVPGHGPVLYKEGILDLKTFLESKYHAHV
jgi:glyoxylase-like metal-dependent hydrolase (beta-lactamase superfamily II)